MQVLSAFTAFYPRYFTWDLKGNFVNSLRMSPTLFSDILLPVTLGVIMGGMGLSLTLDDFRNIFRYPKDVVIGLICQMILLPAVAFGLAYISGYRPELQVGFVLIAACPGGATSNLISYLLKANVPLSISLTSLNSLITLISIPLLVNLGLWAFMGETTSIELPVLDTMLRIFLVVLLPVFIGIMIRRYFHDFADRLDKPLRFVLPALLLFVFLGVMFLDEKDPAAPPLWDYLFLFPLAFALNLVAMTLGFFASRLVKLKKISQVTIAIEVGLQNSALAIFVASSLLGNREMAMVAVVYGAFTFFSTAGIAWTLNRFLR